MGSDASSKGPIPPPVPRSPAAPALPPLPPTIPPPPPSISAPPPKVVSGSQGKKRLQSSTTGTSQVASGVGSARSVFWRDDLPQAEDGSDESHRGVERWLATAPSWLFSLIVHLLLILCLGLIATPYGQRITNVVLELGTADDGGDAIETFTLEGASVELAESPLDAVEMVESPDVLAAEIESFAPSPLTDAVESTDADVTRVAIISAGMLSGRSGSSREALLAAYGGTAETEDAVQMGLAWLARNQEKTGSWSLRGPFGNGAGSENRLAATAMALLAFQGNGNTHQEGPYKAEVEKGVKWLVRQQKQDGFMGTGLPTHQKMYAQAQASIVLCELYAMTEDSWLRGPAQLAIEFAESSQSAEGGWRYEPRQDSDTSVTGWFVMALCSGQAAGLEVSPETIRQVGYFLDRVQHYEGAAYAYQINSGPSTAMTAEGMLCRQYLGWRRDSEPMARCAESLSGDYLLDEKDKDFYYWYYATQVLHHFGGSPWRIWNEKMRVMLPAMQVTEGRDRGSWDPQSERWGPTAGRLYTTCMAIFCLEVYYRHMPLYDVQLK